jgi:hypothetical protein
MLCRIEAMRFEIQLRWRLYVGVASIRGAPTTMLAVTWAPSCEVVASTTARITGGTHPCLRQIPGYITGHKEEVLMGNSQRRAIETYRSRLSARGLARFEVLGRRADRELIRTIARRLAEDSPEASQLRSVVSQSVAGEPPKKGGILAALRRSPLVGADLDLSRSREQGRKVEI